MRARSSSSSAMRASTDRRCSSSFCAQIQRRSAALRPGLCWRLRRDHPALCLARRRLHRLARRGQMFGSGAAGALDDGARLLGRFLQKLWIVDPFGNASREEIGVGSPGLQRRLPAACCDIGVMKADWCPEELQSGRHIACPLRHEGGPSVGGTDEPPISSNRARGAKMRGSMKEQRAKETPVPNVTAASRYKGCFLRLLNVIDHRSASTGAMLCSQSCLACPLIW